RDPVLRIEGLTRDGEFAPLDLALRPGEIVGHAGLGGGCRRPPGPRGGSWPSCGSGTRCPPTGGR
ncbi:hypothetical protein AB0E83_30080, partial [Streptomyces sp. NPDC035033]|uniref:hypothetical protein n=1 Tax=Streptomyces sp. NPDC035033 TaxID=3155368 RepID=UPI00340FE120